MTRYDSWRPSLEDTDRLYRRVEELEAEKQQLNGCIDNLRAQLTAIQEQFTDSQYEEILKAMEATQFPECVYVGKNTTVADVIKVLKEVAPK